MRDGFTNYEEKVTRRRDYKKHLNPEKCYGPPPKIICTVGSVASLDKYDDANNKETTLETSTKKAFNYRGVNPDPSAKLPQSDTKIFSKGMEECKNGSDLETVKANESLEERFEVVSCDKNLNIKPIPIMDLYERQVSTFTGLSKRTLRKWIRKLEENEELISCEMNLSKESSVCLFWTRIKLNMDYESLGGMYDINGE